MEDNHNSSPSPNGQLDGIILSTPTFTHQEIIRQAADANISVFTEKPVDENAERIQKLFAYTQAAGIQLCCGFQRRFDPSYVAAKNAVQNGEIGTPVTANIFFADHPCPPKEFLLTGGNIFMDLSAHDCDFITDTLQDHVVSVYATGTSSDSELDAAGVHDNATMVMKMSKGRQCETQKAEDAVVPPKCEADVVGHNCLYLSASCRNRCDSLHDAFSVVRVRSTVRNFWDRGQSDCGECGRTHYSDCQPIGNSPLALAAFLSTTLSTCFWARTGCIRGYDT